ncbi:dTDP-4-dehydrorhamnose 3,5-epimerase [Gammaproteobacteria bacterium]
MQVTSLALPGLLRVELDLHGDARGFFVERFNQKEYQQYGLPIEFKQDNHSRSAPGVLRGLHYQYGLPQGKLVGVLRGKIWDVVLDIRPSSLTYGKSLGIELSDLSGHLLWVPPGFAHGFCVLGDEPADLLYKVTEFYNPQGEKGIHWADPDAAIRWPIQNPVVSARDNLLPTFSSYRINPIQWNQL